MNTLNPLFAIVVFLIAYATSYVINLKYKVNNLSSRYESIDGLRGFLAIGVFIHHSSIWIQYLQTNKWDAPKSNLYAQLGSTSVAFFFMITSFLFISKLLNLKEKEFNWKAFFISRFFRLTPMYYFSVSIIILFVMIINDWKLKVGIFRFFGQILMWGTFTIVRNTSINGYYLTSRINAGVVWSLPYEWLFYFSLPLISLLILKKKPSNLYILISFVFIILYFFVNNFDFHHILSFVGGAIAAIVVKFKPFKTDKNSFFSSILILLCFVLIGQFKNSDNVICKILITIVFVLIASGNTLFGVLKNATLKFLGEISYSTYLMHGIILFAVFYFGFGFEKIKSFTPLEFWGLIFLITPVVVIFSFLGYKFIEKPFMEISKKINK
ncbi:acyltransferase [Flavobacterium sp. MC2016-06]|uniref:acyltransferase family protein n=1 Tax=Flavobacterium sp. MC2016-06 TaxID=2676308 RepID=UPI0012BA8C09|nr:acyltransferase [Flavobacterium sp. MC2016-06]MBU3859075.1 acyltransferase [Flavobacterium sp. MC2016-06]